MLQFPNCLRILFTNVIWRRKPSEKVIYLTFDDGPVPEVTPAVLEILKKYDCKATFFCVGDNVRKHNDLYHEIINQGHKVGNHTFNHIKAFSCTTQKYIDNVTLAAEYINSKFFRPPHGQIKPSLIKRLKSDYEIVMWDYITSDYNPKYSPMQILDGIKKNHRNGSIVVFHDSLKAKQNVLAVLPDAIEFWIDKGYQIKHL